jgi:NAD(P)-dependent dehydrogenase (short-subunit alcohol dehydrogenase family)
MDFSRGLENKVILITGGCGDIGGATAAKLAELGAHVVIFDLFDQQAGEARTHELGGTAYRKVDQGDAGQVQDAVAAVAKEFKRLDTVIGNAGIGPGGNVIDMTEADWLEVLRVNLIGCAMLAKAGLKAMLAQDLDADGIRGKVLFTSSWVGDFPSPGADGYCVSKAGVNHMTRLIAQRHAPDRILANALAPGILDAGLTKKAAFQRDAELRKKFQSYIPLGEYGTAQQVADAFVFLCSRESNYMTGHVMVVDGGCTLTKRV